jgi:adenosylhomocysteine nucleosidase
MWIAIRALILAAWLGCGAAAVERGAPAAASPKAVVIVSANMEWRVVQAVYPDARLEQTPWGEAFERALDVGGRPARVVFFHGGWGKVAAAGSTQYAIDRWRPRYVVNLGTAGGFAGKIERHAVVLVDRTIIYDIVEAMGDSAEAIASYAATLDLSWLRAPYPSAVTKTLLVSGDRDLVPGQLAELAAKYNAVAGDWESGAIAYTCARNHQRVLILRGISDLVHEAGGEAYGNMPAFEQGARIVMQRLLHELPAWLERMP